MNDSLRRFALGLYALWLLATVLLILGKYTPFPRFRASTTRSCSAR